MIKKVDGNVKKGGEDEHLPKVHEEDLKDV